MRKPENIKILAIVPAYNEEGKIGKVVQKIKMETIVDAIVVVDDCSSDNTSTEASEAGAVVIRHKINRGVGAAIRTGIYYGKDNGFSIGVVLSGDDQHEPAEIERVVEPILLDRADFVQGSRWMVGGKVVNEQTFRKYATKFYALFFSLLTFSRITDGTNGFRAFRLSLFDGKYINLDQAWLDRYELEPYILYKAVKSKSVRVKEVPITIFYHSERRQYTKMKPIRDWWRIARPVIFLTLGLRR